MGGCCSTEDDDKKPPQVSNESKEVVSNGAQGLFIIF